MSKLFIQNNCIVFSHEDIVIKNWDNFQFLKDANKVIGQFYDDRDLDPLSLYDFKKQNNLNSFLDEKQLDKEYRAYLKKSRHVLFYQKYKISTRNFKRIFNSLMREIWVKEPYYSKFCFTNKNPKPHLVYRLKENLHLLQQTKNKNILPIVFWSGLSEEIIQNTFSKEILKNSEHKNTLLSRRVFNNHNDIHAIESLKKNNDWIAREYDKWNQIKSTNLKNLWMIRDFNLVFILGKLFKAKDLTRDITSFEIAPWTRTAGLDNEIKLLIRKIQKTYEKANRLKEHYSIHWTLDQWLELSKELN